LLADWAEPLARILRAETGHLSAGEIGDALSQRLSFGPDDVTIVDWNAALVRDAEGDETRAMLEFANVQLLELRHLDTELDRALEAACDAVAAAERGGVRTLRPPKAALHRVGELQIDSAILFERVSNALKLVGDQFLSRLYRMVSQRFHVADWDRSIIRKLEALDGIYEKLFGRVTARRLEVLEWIVILLIAFEIGLTLVGR